MSSSVIDDYEKGLIHIMLSCRCLSKEKLEELMQEIAPDFPRRVERPLADTLKRMNKALKFVNFEVRSVLIRDSDTNERSEFFAIANLEADNVAVECGGPITENEVPTFNKIVNHLVKESYENEHTLTKVAKPNSWTPGQMSDYLIQLKGEGWLAQQQDSSYWTIGPRSHIELRLMLEQILIDELPETETEHEFQALRSDALARLPQVLMY